MKTRRTIIDVIGCIFSVALVLTSSQLSAAEEDWLPDGPALEHSQGEQVIDGERVRKHESRKSPSFGSRVSGMFGSVAKGTRRFFSRTVDVLTLDFLRDDESAKVVSRYPSGASQSFPLSSPGNQEKVDEQSRWSFGSFFGRRSKESRPEDDAPTGWISQPRP